jgi:hypothetical protein
MRVPSISAPAGILAVSLLLGGCTIKATLDQTTDTTTNVTGTTSSAHGWITDDGLLKPQYKPIAFVTANRVNIQQDLAAGHGEYLTSLGTLLGVPRHHLAAYGVAVQARYADRLADVTAAPETWLAVLQDTAQPFQHQMSQE